MPTRGNTRASVKGAVGIQSPTQRSRRGRRTGALAGLILASIALPAWAQTNDEVTAALQFDFSPPGARSLALGNAFVGLADDATAAYANPAGLLRLTRPEVSVEVRHRRDRQTFPDRGSASGTPTGQGIDTVDDLVFSEQESQNTGVGFLSYVGVAGERLRWAVYRHEAARFDADIESQGPFIRSAANRSRLAALSGRLELDLINVGVSAAYALSDRVWLGLGVSYYSLHLDAVTRRYLTVDLESPVSKPSFDPVPLIAANVRDRHVQQSDDDALAAILGVMWRGSGDRWSAGLVYRQSPEFDLGYSFQWGRQAIAQAAGDRDGDGVLDQEPNLNWVDPGVEDALSGRTVFKVPEMWSVGLAWRPTPAWTLSFEANRVAYSDLRPKANILLSGLDRQNACGDFDPNGNPQPRDPCFTAPLRFQRFAIPDVTELHLGMEYVFGGSLPWALRWGAWHEPDHHLTFEDPRAAPEDRFAARFRPGDDQTHWTVGVGLAFRRLQLDFAVDLSDSRDVASLSTVYRF